MPAAIIFCRKAKRRRPRDVFGENDSVSHPEALRATLVLDMHILPSRRNNIRQRILSLFNLPTEVKWIPQRTKCVIGGRRAVSGRARAEESRHSAAVRDSGRGEPVTGFVEEKGPGLGEN